MKCDIIMVTWNATKMTATALSSIQANSNFPYRIILVDNSDTDEGRKYYKKISESNEYGETVLIQNNQNIGWLKATNIGLTIADSEYVCLLNNDVICGPNWLKNCIYYLHNFQEVGLVNPRGNERSENNLACNINIYANFLEIKNKHKFTEIPHCTGFCMLAKKDLFKKIGLLDEIYSPGYYEDNDLSMRARSIGLKCIQADDSFVFHIGSQSFGKIPSKTKSKLIEKNKAIYETRYGIQKRKLLIIKNQEINTEEIIEEIRKNKIYLIKSGNIPEKILKFRHSNLILLENKFKITYLSFLYYKYYLLHKKRISDAEILL